MAGVWASVMVIVMIIRLDCVGTRVLLIMFSAKVVTSSLAS